jgi:hypothetical protein
MSIEDVAFSHRASRSSFLGGSRLDQPHPRVLITFVIWCHLRTAGRHQLPWPIGAQLSEWKGPGAHKAHRATGPLEIVVHVTTTHRTAAEIPLHHFLLHPRP